jgi:S-adenosylmethionine decarboxylase
MTAPTEQAIEQPNIKWVTVTTATQGTTPSILGDISEMCSYAMDAWFDELGILTDEAALLSVMHEAADVGGATVLGQTSAVFPNGALTAALLLSESHLTVHTWPEHGLARFDLLTCGSLNAELILSHLRSELKPTRSKVVRAIHDMR